MTVHILSAGDGYAYYTNETATADVQREAGRELGDYYTADGNPPGVWVGSGITALGVSGTVSEAQMKALYGEGLHPDADALIADAQANGKSAEDAIRAAKLGRSYYAYTQNSTNLREKVATGYGDFTRMNHREPDQEERRKIRTRVGAQAFREAKGRPPADKEELGRYITAASRPTQQAVAGFDLVFSPAKSISTLWGLGDNDTRKLIEEAHEAAITETIGYLEREAIATRAGTNGVAQIDVEGGLIATRFRHYDSRTGDPQLHDHLVVANKVKGSDGKWRTIDSKLLHRQGVAASEYYNQQVMDRVTDALQVTTELREVTAGKRTVVEIAGIDERLTQQFSSRSTGIKTAVKKLEKEYRATHGRAPDTKARIQLAQQATLDTRPQKPHARSLAELRKAWRVQAGQIVGDRVVGDITRTAQAHARGSNPDSPTPAHVSLEVAAAAVVESVSEHHAVWGPHTIEAEARRYVQAQRSAGHTVDGTVEQITRHALSTDSITVTPPAPHGTFQPLTRRDGASIYEHKGRQLLTSRAVLTAEDTLLDAARDRTMQPVARETFDRIAAEHGQHLDPGQRDLARAFATSSNRLVVGSGPAGTGKTTALKVAARAIEAEGGKMIGFAPSAAAAAVMRDAIGIDASTIHSLTFQRGTLHELLQRTEPLADVTINRGDVIVVDEAGMAGSMNLAKVTRIAELHGAHVRLIGDDKQLGAVEAGGALRLIEHEVGSVKLETIHRFRNADGTANRAEADASALLRDPVSAGDPFAWYLAHDRIVAGDSDRMTNAVFAAWQQDTAAGTRSVMIAQKNDTVQELNLRAQAMAMATGTVTGTVSADLSDGLAAHAGDRIVTRANDKEMKLNSGRDFVRNGDVWSVDKVHTDGALTVTHEGHGGTITLPADYVTKSTQLGYASTVHRSQGLTVETSHLLADAETTRALAYVAMTRGSMDNRMYVVTDDAQTRAEVLEHISTNTDGVLSATETIRAEHNRVDDLPTLIDQYRDVEERAHIVRFTKLAHEALPQGAADQLVSSDGWGAVTAALARAEEQELDPALMLRTSWYQRELGSAEDVGAVMSYRLERRLDDEAKKAEALARQEETVEEVVPEGSPPAVPAWIAGRRAIDSPLTDEAWRDHLTERYDYLTVRIEERGTTVAAEQPAWAQQLGEIPADASRRQQWVRLAAEVDVFRTQYRIDPAVEVAVPAEYRQRPLGAELAARVTAMHKATALSTQPSVDVDARARAAAEATATVRNVREAVTPTAQATATPVATVPERREAAAPTAQPVSPAQAAEQPKRQQPAATRPSLTAAQAAQQNQQRKAAALAEQLRRQGINAKVHKASERTDSQFPSGQDLSRGQDLER
jgi:conjugative relaxase-like TrwC/TraI family protein